MFCEIDFHDKNWLGRKKKKKLVPKYFKNLHVITKFGSFKYITQLFKLKIKHQITIYSVSLYLKMEQEREREREREKTKYICRERERGRESQ